MGVKGALGSHLKWNFVFERKAFLEVDLSVLSN